MLTPVHGHGHGGQADQQQREVPPLDGVGVARRPLKPQAQHLPQRQRAHTGAADGQPRQEGTRRGRTGH
ncbi:hypothetical protein [Acidovorax carolinensis]|uniref:hypothetical protein n=1 Tax=Acidovorax carolinensis TaxID=553814 RepID=UPI001F2C8516|nr:hypothetical protein [Acidovorax carolinensis]